MIGKELVWHLRESILDDIAIPFLWPDTELLRFLNYAEVQACRRAHILIDSETTTDYGTAATASTAGTKALCQLVLSPNTAVYQLSSKVLQVKRGQMVGLSYPLVGPVSAAELDDTFPEWRGTNGTVGTCGSSGNPIYITNEPNDHITFVLAPSIAGTANLVVSRLPLVQFSLETAPEIPEQYHIDLCDWAAHLAYSKPDTDTFNAKLAQFYADKFTKNFGPLPDVFTERRRKSLTMKDRMRPREFGM